MSAVEQIKPALAQAVFPVSRVKGALDQLIDSLDEDLDRTGYQPSRVTQARVQELLRALEEAGAARAAPDDVDEEERDTQRLS